MWNVAWIFTRGARGCSFLVVWARRAVWLPSKLVITTNSSITKPLISLFGRHYSFY